jgi:DNA helicase-4
MRQGGDVELRCLDIVSISTNKTLLWHTVEIRARGRTDVLSGLTGETAAQLAADLHAFINTHLFDLICAESQHLLEVGGRLQEITENNRQYLAQADLGRTICRTQLRPQMPGTTGKDREPAGKPFTTNDLA